MCIRDGSEVVVQMEASVYVASDDVDVETWGNSKVYLPSAGVYGSQARVRLEGDSELIRGVDASMGLTN